MHKSSALFEERISAGIEVLGGKWTVRILCAMRDKPARLSELRRLFPKASKKALTASLRSLETAGLIERRDLGNSVLHVEYRVSDAVREPLLSLISHLSDWGEAYEKISLGGGQDDASSDLL